MADVQARIAMAFQRFGKRRHIWRDGDLHRNLRMRLYKACVCSVLTYGSEAWTLSAEVTAALNGVNARMVCVITGRTPHEEASAKGKTFDLLQWIRSRACALSVIKRCKLSCARCVCPCTPLASRHLLPSARAKPAPRPSTEFFLQNHSLFSTFPSLQIYLSSS